jgi:hypothetical protein
MPFRNQFFNSFFRARESASQATRILRAAIGDGLVDEVENSARNRYFLTMLALTHKMVATLNWILCPPRKRLARRNTGRRRTLSHLLFSLPDPFTSAFSLHPLRLCGEKSGLMATFLPAAIQRTASKQRQSQSAAEVRGRAVYGAVVLLKIDPRSAAGARTALEPGAVKVISTPF